MSWFPNKIDSHPIFLNEPQKQQCNGPFYGRQFQLQLIYKKTGKSFRKKKQFLIILFSTIYIFLIYFTFCLFSVIINCVQFINFLNCNWHKPTALSDFVEEFYYVF